MSVSVSSLVSHAFLIFKFNSFPIFFCFFFFSFFLISSLTVLILISFFLSFYSLSFSFSSFLLLFFSRVSSPTEFQARQQGGHVPPAPPRPIHLREREKFCLPHGGCAIARFHYTHHQKPLMSWGPPWLNRRCSISCWRWPLTAANLWVKQAKYGHWLLPTFVWNRPNMVTDSCQPVNKTGHLWPSVPTDRRQSATVSVNGIRARVKLAKNGNSMATFFACLSILDKA